MKKIKALYKKEMGFYLNGSIGYITAFLFGLFANFLFIKDLFLRDNASMRPFFETLIWLLIIFIPAMSMRIFSEEKRANTLEVLLSLPVREVSVVFAKYLALMTFSIISLLLTLSVPATFLIISRPALSNIVVSYIGTLFVISAFVSASMYFSSLTKNQIAAFLSSLLFLFFLIMVGSEFLAPVLPRIIQEKIMFLSPVFHFENFLKGIVGVRSVSYFVSLSLVFLFMTVINTEKRS